MRSRHPSLARGFTLVEILVATSILALMSIMAYRGLTAVRDGEQHLAAVSERWLEIARAVERFGRDVRQSVEYPGKDATGKEMPVFYGQAFRPDRADEPELALIRVGSEESGSRRLGYRLRDGKLELLLWKDPGTQPQSYVVLPGVRQLDITYLNAQGAWSERWPLPASDWRPRAVRIILQLEEGIRIERIFDLP